MKPQVCSLIRSTLRRQLVMWVTCVGFVLSGCEEKESQTELIGSSKDPFSKGIDLTPERNANAATKLNKLQLEKELKTITVPWIQLANDDFALAVAMVVSRGTELSPSAPVDFPYKFGEASLKSKKVSVEVSSVSCANLLDILCEHAGAVWSVEDGEDTKGVIVIREKNN